MRGELNTPSAPGGRKPDRMAHSSYFHEIAPTAGPSPSAALAPVPPLFPPGAMPAAFLEVETLNAPRRQTVGTRAGAAPPAAHDQAQGPELGATQPTIAGAGRQNQFPAPGPQRIGRDEIRDAPRTNGPFAPTPPATQVARPAMATTAAGAVAPQPTNEPERHRPAVRGDASSPVAPQSIAPLITPPAPAPTPAAKPTPAGPAGVHIGTLEVRVVAPPATPQTSPLRPRIPTRAPPLRQARSGARLSRGFGVFGLGQS
jgi:hypothetical protein